MSSVMRSVDTRFWNDVWVRHLNALDRYAFLYFLTNPHSTWCGVYEVDLSMIAFETGIDEHDLVKSILPRLSPKVMYIDGWIYVSNWVKYHLSESGSMSPQQKKGYEKAFDQVPERIRLKIRDFEKKGIPYAYPIGGVSPSSSSSSSSSASTSTSSLIAPTSGAETEVWNLEEKLKEMEKTENSPLDIIASFIREKPVRVDNAKQLSAVIVRNMRIAKQLSGTYTNAKIFSAVQDIEDDVAQQNSKGRGYDWGLETVFKKLTKN